jgi:hypothetical protein
MIRRSPSEYYLKYLIVHPDAYDDDDLLENICPELGLDALGHWYLDKLHQACEPPVPFHPHDSMHFVSQKFLRREKLHDAFQPSEGMKQARAILNRPRVRELIEVMMLSGAPDTAVEDALVFKFGFEIAPKCVKLYRHYFWNLELLDTTETRAILQMRFENVLDSKEPGVKAQYSSLSKNLYTDPRVSAARLPGSPLTALVAQIQMGVMPKGVNLAEVVEATRLMASMRTLESVAIGGPKGAEMASKFSATAESMHRMMETVIKPEEQLREDLAKIAMKSDPSRVPLLSELSGGQHTTDLQPEPESDEDDPELVVRKSGKG